MDMPRTTNFFS